MYIHENDKMIFLAHLRCGHTTAMMHFKYPKLNTVPVFIWDEKDKTPASFEQFTKETDKTRVAVIREPHDRWRSGAAIDHIDGNPKGTHNMNWLVNIVDCSFKILPFEIFGRYFGQKKFAYRNPDGRHDVLDDWKSLYVQKSDTNRTEFLRGLDAIVGMNVATPKKLKEEREYYDKIYQKNEVLTVEEWHDLCS